MASGIIISLLRDASLPVVFEAEDYSTRITSLLDFIYASSRRVSAIALQTRLFRISYKDQSMYSYIDQYSSLFGSYNGWNGML